MHVQVADPYPASWDAVRHALDTVKKCAGALHEVAAQMAGQNPSGHEGLHHAQQQLVAQMADARREAVAALVDATEASLAECDAEAVQHVRPMGVPVWGDCDELPPGGVSGPSDEGETEAPKYTGGADGIPQ